jgi:predicted nucleic acid-binding protein
VILVDTSIWVNHFRRSDDGLAGLLQQAEVLCHPFVIGELSCGYLKNRREILRLLADLPSAAIADHQEVLQFVEMRKLMGQGIGWIDAHLLASTVISNCTLWTVDKKLRASAEAVGVAY